MAILATGLFLLNLASKGAAANFTFLAEAISLAIVMSSIEELDSELAFFSCEVAVEVLAFFLSGEDGDVAVDLLALFLGGDDGEVSVDLLAFFLGGEDGDVAVDLLALFLGGDDGEVSVNLLAFFLGGEDGDSFTNASRRASA